MATLSVPLGMLLHGDLEPAMIVLVALLCLTLMTGNELCVAVFVNPVLRQLPESQQTPFLRREASLLGAAMPIWYATSLALTAAAAFVLHRHGTAWLNLGTWSALVQLAVILVTVTLLVPINNRLGKLREEETGWTAAAERWDRLHQLRVGALLMAMLLLAVEIASVL